MSVHIRGIGPDGQWLTQAERNDMRHEFMPPVEAVHGDALARLEAWHLSGEGRHSFVNTSIGEFIVEIDDHKLTVQRCDPSLSAAIHAALDQWEAT